MNDALVVELCERSPTTKETKPMNDDDEREVLHAIRNNPGIHVNDLVKHTALSQSRIYKAFIQLEKQQLIERNWEMCVTASD